MGGNSAQVDATKAAVGNRPHPRAIGLAIDEGLDLGPVAVEDRPAVGRRLALPACEDEPAHPVLDPRQLLRRSIADPAVAGDHDQPLGADDGEPLVVDGTSWNLREAGMARGDDSAVLLGEVLAERQVVLVSEGTGPERLAAADPGFLLEGRSQVLSK